MRKILIVTGFLLLCVFTLGASGAGDQDSYSVDAYYRAISRNLGHKLDENEQAVAKATYVWYQKKCEEKWDRKLYDLAVEKGTENCKNDVMLAAAKAGTFGEKLLKALVVSAGDAADAVSEWVEANSERYDKGK